MAFSTFVQAALRMVPFATFVTQKVNNISMAEHHRMWPRLWRTGDYVLHTAWHIGVLGGLFAQPLMLHIAAKQDPPVHLMLVFAVPQFVATALYCMNYLWAQEILDKLLARDRQDFYWRRYTRRAGVLVWGVVMATVATGVALGADVLMELGVNIVIDLSKACMGGTE